MILVLGLLGFLLPLLFILAWGLGNNQLDESEAAGVEPDGSAKTGRLIGKIGTYIVFFIPTLAVIIIFVLTYLTA